MKYFYNDRLEVQFDNVSDVGKSKYAEYLIGQELLKLMRVFTQILYCTENEQIMLTK